MEDILPYLGISRNYGPEDAQLQEIVLEDLSGLTSAQAGDKLKKMGLSASVSGTGEVVTGQIPSAGMPIPGGGQVLLYLGEAPEEKLVAVPDFSGMTRQQASDASSGLYLLISGNPVASPTVTVVSQNIPAGTQVKMGTTVTLTFYDHAARD
jgi:stage V sporulation protein D (sporulation-specific penicillin-binding protein)